MCQWLCVRMELTLIASTSAIDIQAHVRGVPQMPLESASLSGDTAAHSARVAVGRRTAVQAEAED